MRRAVAAPSMGPSVISLLQNSQVKLAGRARVDLVHLVYLVSLVQLNKRDRPNRLNERERLADFFSILLTQRRMNPVAHIVRDRNYADANNYMLRNDFPGRDLLGPRQEIAQHREQREAPHHAHHHGLL